MNKGTLLIVGMMLGFEKGHEIYDGIDWDSAVADELLDAKAVTKEDIFSMTPNGKSFFQYKRAWENFKKLTGFMDRQGDRITVEDLKKVVVDNKTVIDLAAECEAVEEIFAPALWVGHAEEMEKLWFSLDKDKRRGLDFEEINSALARLEGRETRADQLKEAGVTPKEMHTAIRLADWASVRDKLEKNGDHLRMADIKFCDEHDDHALFLQHSWNRFPELVAEWKEHGEVPDTEFFHFKRGNRPSIIEQAFIVNKQDKIFNADVFEGRPDEMMRLYDTLSAHDKRKVDIDSVLSDIIEDITANLFTIDNDLSLSTLTAPLYDLPGADVIIPLGLEKTWNNIHDVRSILGRKGETITLDDLRTPSGIGGESCLFRAVRSGHLDTVLDMLAESGEQLEASDLLHAHQSGQTALSLIEQQGQLDRLLDSQLWSGRAADLAEIWESLPPYRQSDLRQEFNRVHNEANRLALRRLGQDREGTAMPPPAASGPSL